MMVGVKTKATAGDIVKKCMEKGVLLLTAKDKVRLLPALNIPKDVLAEALEIIKSGSDTNHVYLDSPTWHFECVPINPNEIPDIDLSKMELLYKM